MIPEALKNSIEEKLSAVFASETTISESKSVGGGSINHAAHLKTSFGDCFVKWNKKSAYPQMFELEEMGLHLLSTGNHIRVPKTIATGEAGDLSFLLMEWISSGSKTTDFWQIFGRQLAEIHSETSDQFGWSRDNYMGALHQSNAPSKSWSQFFIENRLEPQLKMAVDSGFTFKSGFDKIYKVVESEVPVEKPALVHGDLWSGNFIATPDQKPVLIDPAAYFGHREVDVAMSTLFGGFHSDFYSSYNSQFPMEQGWQSRLDLHNLYPLLIHVNLFGSGYVSQVDQILRKFN